MNSILLWLGIVVALVLSAAFAAPFFIDWSDQRAFFEARASSILGRPVEFAGPLEVRLMPFPSLIARDVRLGEDAGPAAEGADQVVMRAALAPLLSGELQISEVIITRPRTVFAIDREGRPGWATQEQGLVLPVAPARTRIDRFEIRDGSITLEDERTGARHEMTGLNLAGAAGTLEGPFRAEGGGTIGSTRYTLQVATGRIQSNDTIRVTGSIVPADRPLTMDFDGSLAFGGTSPTYSGSLVMERPGTGEAGPIPWRMEASVAASLEELLFDRLLVHLGAADQRISLAGEAQFELGAEPRFDGLLTTRQIDFDRTFGGGPDEPVTPAEVLRRLSNLLDPTIFPAPGRLSLEVPSVVLSGNLVENLMLDLDVEQARWRIARAAARIPGRGDISIAGTIEHGEEGPSFEGRASISADQAATAVAWLAGPEASIPDIGVMAGELEASGDVRLGSNGLEIEQFMLSSPSSQLAGSLSYAPAVGEVSPRLALRIETDQLDLDGIRSAATGSILSVLVPPDGLELDVQLEAERVVAGLLEAGDVGLSMAVADGNVWVERLFIGNFGGARIEGEGDIRDAAGSPDGTFALDLDAPSLAAFADVLTELGMEEAATELASRAEALAPAQLAFSLSARRNDAEGSIGQVRLSGEAGGTALNVSLAFEGRLDQFDQANIDLSLEATNSDAARLVQQLGVAADLEGGADASVSLSARGTPAESMPFTLTANGIGVDGSAEGRARFTPRGGRDIAATFGFRIPRLGALVELAGIELPASSDAAGRLDGQLSAVDDVWRLSDLVLTSPSQRSEGSLVIDWSKTDRVLEGQVRTGAIDVPWLLGVALGPEAFAGAAEAGAWPESAFAPVDRSGWRGRISVETPALHFQGRPVATNAAFDINFEATRLTFDEISANAFGGVVSGDLDLATADGAVRLDARMDLVDARLDEIVWRSDGRPLARGRISAGAELSANGRSVSGIVSSLSGDGSFRVEDGTIRRLNPRAFDQIVRAADAGLELTEGRVRDVFAGHLDSGSLSFNRAEGAFVVASGVARARTVQLATDQIDSFVSAAVDLNALTLESEWVLRLDSDEEDQRVREAGIVFAGPVAEPGRSIDVNPLLGYLTVRAFEQEVERLERLQADISERERLGRELRRFGEQRQRREREAAEELRRQQEEEQRQAEEEERLAAEEEEARSRSEAEAQRDQEDAMRRAQAAREEAEREQARRRAEQAERAQTEREEEEGEEAEERDADLRRLIEDALRDPQADASNREQDRERPVEREATQPRRGPLIITPPGVNQPMTYPGSRAGQVNSIIPLRLPAPAPLN